jgi:hypothetical protein
MFANQQNKEEEGSSLIPKDKKNQDEFNQEQPELESQKIALYTPYSQYRKVFTDNASTRIAFCQKVYIISFISLLF